MAKPLTPRELYVKMHEPSRDVRSIQVLAGALLHQMPVHGTECPACPRRAYCRMRWGN